jgi:hypothetical protein
MRVTGGEHELCRRSLSKLRHPKLLRRARRVCEGQRVLERFRVPNRMQRRDVSRRM